MPEEPRWALFFKTFTQAFLQSKGVVIGHQTNYAV